jgi:serine/threonine protein kinase
MGEVYLACDSQLDRKVALKLLPVEFTSNPKWVQRFRREAKAASALNHPNILTIHEIGQIEQFHYMATEFVDGLTLRTLLSNRSLDLPRTLEVATQIASALAAAHAANIVHRDIKPENIIVRHDGLVKVLDFGLAKQIESTPAHDASTTPMPNPDTRRFETDPGVLMGTVRYMSPEQTSGLHVDSRTDIFSFGILLFEA